mgnify:CR=1 FL=1
MTSTHKPTAVSHLLASHVPGQERLRVLSASGQLGFGIVQDSLARGLQRKPHFIGCDMGSIDPGPFYLGSGQMAAPKDMVLRDLELVLLAARQLDVPLIIGSAGTAGAQPQLEATYCPRCSKRCDETWQGCDFLSERNPYRNQLLA